MTTSSSSSEGIIAIQNVAIPPTTVMIQQSSNVKPTYSVLRSNIIRITPESMQCKLYCRGSACKYCSPTGWTAEDQAISGVYSSWVTDEILAMARPTQIAIQQYDILKQFKQKKIKTIINLQCINEHAFCGPPLLLCGFSYDPEMMMRNKIYYYNFAMPDFGFSNVYSLLNIVKVMWFAAKQGRIAIHCHAGLGRTCTLIACYLMWANCWSCEKAVSFVRSKRRNSIQSPRQIDLIEQMWELIKKYAMALPEETGLSLTNYISMQNDFISSDETRKFSHVPKIIYCVCNRLLQLIFDKGIRYEIDHESKNHNVRSCTIGYINVEWKIAYTSKGRAQMRYIVNLFNRLRAFPFDKDDAVQQKFKNEVTLINIEESLIGMDASQLISLLNYFMEIFKRPYCDMNDLIAAFDYFSPNNTNEIPPQAAPAEQQFQHQKLESSVQTTEVEAPIPDKKKKLSSPKCNAPWQCLVFYLCNALSYMTGENYDVVVDVISIWLINDLENNLKSAIHTHMRDLFARNLHEQQEQSSKKRQALLLQK